MTRRFRSLSFQAPRPAPALSTTPSRYFKISNEKLCELFQQLQPPEVFALMRQLTGPGGDYHGQITYEALRDRWIRTKKTLGIPTWEQSKKVSSEMDQSSSNVDDNV